MKKKKTGIKSKSKYPVLLYREDLQEIENIFKNDLQCSKINISFDDFEADSLADISENTKNTNKISINSNVPSLHVEIQTGYRYISSYGDDDLKIEGAIRKIENILKNSSRINVYYLFQIIKFISLCIFWVMMISPNYLINSFKYTNNILPSKILFPIILGLSLFLSFFLHLYGVVSIISFEQKKLKVNFWTKNRDQILVGIIIAAFGILVGYLIK